MHIIGCKEISLALAGPEGINAFGLCETTFLRTLLAGVGRLELPVRVLETRGLPVNRPAYVVVARY